MPILDYSPPPAFRYQKQLWRYVRIATAMSILLVMVYWGPGVGKQVYYLYWQRQCMNYTLPPGTVTFTNDPPEVARLRAEGYKPVVHFTSQGQLSEPPGSAAYFFKPMQPLGEGFLQRYARVQFGDPARVVAAGSPIPSAARTGAFLHRLRSSGGVERIVAVLFSLQDSPLPGHTDLAIRSLDWEPASWKPGSTMLPCNMNTLILNSAGSTKLQINAGQADPHDASHFTIDFTSDRHAGVIDGWLQDDDNVLLRVRPPAGSTAK